MQPLLLLRLLLTMMRIRCQRLLDVPRSSAPALCFPKTVQPTQGGIEQHKLPQWGAGQLLVLQAVSVVLLRNMQQRGAASAATASPAASICQTVLP
jgi:hypothetical protein